jgi:hypothetical protein
MFDPRLFSRGEVFVVTERQHFGARVKQCCNEIKLFLSSLRLVTRLSSTSSLTLLRADLMDSWTEDTGNSLLAFPLPKPRLFNTTSPARNTIISYKALESSPPLSSRDS